MSKSIAAVIAALLIASPPALAGERWDRVKGFARDHWKPIVGCVAAPALIYKQTRRHEKRMMRDAERRAANHETKAMEAYATRFDEADKNPEYWKGNDIDARIVYVDHYAREADALYYEHAANLWYYEDIGRGQLKVIGPVPLVEKTAPALAFIESRTKRPGQDGYDAYIGKLNKRDSHRRRAVDIRGDAFERRKSVQRSALAIATTLCGFTIKRK